MFRRCGNKYMMPNRLNVRKQREGQHDLRFHKCFPKGINSEMDELQGSGVYGGWENSGRRLFQMIVVVLDVLSSFISSAGVVQGSNVVYFKL